MNPGFRLAENYFGAGLNFPSYILTLKCASLMRLLGLQFVADTPINPKNRKGIAWKPGFEALPRSCFTFDYIWTDEEGRLWYIWIEYDKYPSY